LSCYDGVPGMNQSRGSLSAACAYIIWGLLPIYWKALEQVPAKEILCHRVIWSMGFTLLLILVLNRGRLFFDHLRSRKTMLRVTVSGCLLAVNWLIYIWAVNSGHLVETSLGYFINPLIAVLLAVFILGERLRKGQVLAVCIAFLGVVYLTWSYGRVPWIALSLAISFGLYGLMHKLTRLGTVEGLALETVPVFLPALGFLLFLEHNQSAAFLADGPAVSLLLAFTGVATSIPLLLFGYAAKNIELSRLGLLQYISPSINFVLGLAVYHEYFPADRFIGFSLVWTALLVYVLEGRIVKYRLKKQPLH
jgi:chloramphenicol-sensitive protein RarD